MKKSSLGFVVNILGVFVWYQLGYMVGWGALRNLVQGERFVDYFEWNFQYIPPMLHLGSINDGLLGHNKSKTSLCILGRMYSR